MSLLLVIIVSLASAVVASKHEWTRFTVGFSTDPQAGDWNALDMQVNVTVLAKHVCQLDRLHISWRSSRFVQVEDFGLAFIRSGDRDGSVIELVHTTLMPDQQDVNRAGLITCDINELHCAPKVQEIKAQSNQNLLELQFAQATSQPALPNSTAIVDALAITPTLQYNNASGVWVAPDYLHLHLSDSDLQRILSAHAAGDKIEVSARTQRLQQREGSATIRPSEAGDYRVVVVDRTRGMIPLPQHVSEPQHVRVELCDDAVVMPASIPKPDYGNAEQSALTSGPLIAAGGALGARKLLTVPGPAAVTGTDAMLFSDATIDPKGSGTFTVSTWIKLVEPPTGSFRAVLHKGGTDGKTRTPSIWLMPHDNRLSVRVSTVNNADTGAESIGALPTNTWAHLSLVFENHSHVTSPSAAAESDILPLSISTQDKHTEGGFLISHPADYYAAPHDSQSVAASRAVAPTATPPRTGAAQYTVSVYLNGELDVRMDFSDPVVGNAFSASFFKDVSFTGPKAFFDDFSIWQGALTGDQVRAAFLSTAGRDKREAVDAALQLLARANSSLVFSPTSTEHTVITADPLVPILLQRAKDSLDACDTFESRLDLYADAAERGSAEALYKWALMVKQGSEVGNSACGVATAEETTTGILQGSGLASLWGGASSGILTTTAGTSASSVDQERATLAFLVAADMGHAPALMSLAFTLLNGAGARALSNMNSSSLHAWNIPVHDTYRRSLTAAPFTSAMRDVLMSGSQQCRPVAWKGPLSTQLPIERDVGRSVLQSAQSFNTGNASTLLSVSTARRSLCANPSQLALGLLQVAAMHGVVEAHQALYYRYKEGFGVEADEETAAFYQRLPARVTAEEFDRIGAQAIVETDRIDDSTAPQVSRGNEGNDDELIQHQKVRAQEGHLPSILAMADLYYYGARGLPRDYPRALRYYEQAAALGDQSGLCGAAGMYLKGEGVPSNATHAVSLYETASEMGSIRALNGLGYMYFYGQSVPQNQTKASDYFLAAAAYETDGDSVFNAAHCLENGIGVEKDMDRAVQLYTVGAKKLGSFNCIRSLAGIHLEGRGVPRSVKTALSYYSAATAIGPWSGWMRRGFDQYLRGNYERSVGAYLHAAELGYEVAQSNAAYILRAKLKPHNNGPAVPAVECSADNTSVGTCSVADTWGNSSVLHDRLLSRLYKLSAHHGNRDSFLQLGTCHFKAQCGLGMVNYERALWYYSKASYLGSHLASAYLGVMYHFGLGTTVNALRAGRYYALALEQDTEKSIASFVQSLKYALSVKDYYFMMPVNLGLDYVVRKLW